MGYGPPDMESQLTAVVAAAPRPHHTRATRPRSEVARRGAQKVSGTGTAPAGENVKWLKIGYARSSNGPCGAFAHSVRVNPPRTSNAASRPKGRSRKIGLSVTVKLFP